MKAPELTYYPDDLDAGYDRHGWKIYDAVNDGSEPNATFEVVKPTPPPPITRTATVATLPPIAPITPIPCLFEFTSDKRCGKCWDCKDSYS